MDRANDVNQPGMPAAGAPITGTLAGVGATGCRTSHC